MLRQGTTCSARERLGVRFRANKTGSRYPSSFPTDHSKVVPLLQVVFARASVVSNEVFVLFLFVPHLPFLVPREGCAS